MRDVIQVERAGGAEDVAELARVADELLAPLVARLGIGQLGEIEVRRGTWRVRVRRAPATLGGHGSLHGATPGAALHGMAAAPAPQHGSASPSNVRDVGSGAHGAPADGMPDQPVATSTAVGYFGVGSGITVGHRVARGDVIGWVDVLGVRKEIVSPSDGVVGRFVTEPGDPVEYGQELVSIIPAASTPASADADQAPEAATTTGPAGPV